MTAIETVGAILEVHPEITELALLGIEDGTSLLQDRLIDNKPVQGIIDAGIRIRRELGLPFRDAVLICCFGAGTTAFPILDQVLFHNSPKHKIIVTSDQWSSTHLDQLVQRLPTSNMFAISSRVQLKNGTHRHIPMIDFHCPATPENQAISARAATLIDGSGGYLLRSGKSYHYYGKGLKQDSELTVFLARALLFGPAVDRYWIAHQLMDGECNLRIFAKIGGTAVPYVVAELDGRDRYYT